MATPSNTPSMLRVANGATAALRGARFRRTENQVGSKADSLFASEISPNQHRSPYKSTPIFMRNSDAAKAGAMNILLVAREER